MVSPKQRKIWISQRFLKDVVRLKDEMHILSDNGLRPLHETATIKS